MTDQSSQSLLFDMKNEIVSREDNMLDGEK